MRCRNSPSPYIQSGSRQLTLVSHYPTSSIYFTFIDPCNCASLFRREHPGALRIRQPGSRLLAFIIVKDFIYLSRWHKVVLKIVIGCGLARKAMIGLQFRLERPAVKELWIDDLEQILASGLQIDVDEVAELRALRPERCKDVRSKRHGVSS
jgi:hypothetical protein